MKTFIIFYFGLFSGTFLFAQTRYESVQLWTNYPGYIVTWENDTVYGFIKLSNLVNNQKKAMFYKNADDADPVEKYKPKDIKAFKVGPREYESYKYHVTNETKGFHFFLKVIEGPICMFKWYFEPESRQQERVEIDEDDVLNSKIDLSFNEADLSSNDFMKKQDGEFVCLSSLKFGTNFKKNMSEYVSDFPELAEKIASKEEGYRSIDREKIILEYNEWFLKSHSKQ
ncbi:MAG: hypothetical protein JW731_03995 [Bacteroidales bacterium]|nr:hypothetical protein [Bacteroidales bacterium]